MPNVRYYNQTAPFWDWVANLEGQGLNHPAFGGGNRDTEATESTDNNPWSQWPFQPFQQRAGRHGPRGFHQGPPGPPPPAPEENDEDDPPISTPLEEPEAGPSDARGPPPPPPGFPGHHHPHPHHGHSPPPHHARGGRRGRCGGGRGRPWGGRYNFAPGGLPNGPPAFMQDLAAMFNESLFGGNDNSNTNTNNDGEAETTVAKSEDFTPEADVFDTPDSYVIHLSLPGAKKEDVGVNWDAEKSEINVAGVIYRPGDEEFLKSLALNERKVGAFERMIRLGSRANPAHVDVEGITAKLEDGVLRVTVPKMNGEFVEVRRVDVE